MLWAVEGHPFGNCFTQSSSAKRISKDLHIDIDIDDIDIDLVRSILNLTIDFNVVLIQSGL